MRELPLPHANYTCRNCGHFSPDVEDFKIHAAKHGVDIAQSFEKETISDQYQGQGWQQVIEKITTKEGFVFFQTTVSFLGQCETNGQFGLAI